MKTTFKTLIIAAACTLSIAKTHAWPVLTPEQLKTAPEAVKTESTVRGDFPFKIEEIEYASDGIPKSIKGTNVTPEFLNVELMKHIKPFSLSIHNEQDLGMAGERMQELSETLSAEVLKKRGVDVAKLEELGIKEVREITFDSILKSHFFTDEQRKKAEVWFGNKEKLEKAIEDYANNYPYDLTLFECTLANGNKIEHTVVPSCVIPINTSNISENEGWRLPWCNTLRYKIATVLKNMLRYKNGKEKVVLLLLLDEGMPKEHRLRWGHDCDNLDGSLQPNNLITSDIGGEWLFLSHEIGHFLQLHLGWVQTSKDYQTEFAKRLLLLSNPYPQTPMPISSEMREVASMVDGSLFRLFGKNYFECPTILSANEFFACVQLLLRWGSTAEISNILGVCFNDNTLYLNALSDIRELKRIRYAHNNKGFGNQILKNSGALPEEVQMGIFSRASRMPLPTEMLELLCQLHGRESKDAENVVCDFDCNNEEEWNAHVKPVISDFIEAE